MLPLILINGEPIKLGSELPKEIESLSISVYHMMTIRISNHDSNSIKHWLNEIVDRLTCDHITYNNLIISKKDIKKF
jgi:hypothetical protein